MTSAADAAERVALWLTTYLDALAALGESGEREACDRALDAAATGFGHMGPRWLALDAVERRLALVAMAAELDLEIGRLYADIAASFGQTRPTVSLCLHLACIDDAERLQRRDSLLSGAPLLEGGWLRVEGHPSRAWLESAVCASNGAIQLLLGRQVRGTDHESLCTLWPPGPTLDEVVLGEAQRAHIDRFLARAQSQERADRSLALLLSGPSGTGKTMTARACAAALGRPLLLVDPLGGGLRRDFLEARLQSLAREAALLDGVLFFDECEGWFESRSGGDRTVLRMLELLDREGLVAILATNMPNTLDPALDRRVALHMEFQVPKRREREALWRLHLRSEPLAEDVDLSWLAERYELSGGHIANAAEAARQGRFRRDEGQGAIAQADLEAAADEQVRHRLSRLAVETPTNLTLADLVVRDDIGEKLHEIIAAVRNRRMLFEDWGFGAKLSTGRGLCMLFRGDPGTGKTLSAEVLAAELKMPLYRASIPKIVSKYVGETERNLERTFREASAARGLLLFDEADSLFSKRVDVSTAQDRYSNMEVNLLLQEIERFDGVVILTTNLNAAIDDAFERRLNFKLDFPFPKADERARIWRRLIPDRAPLEGEIDFEELGELYELSGGSIKNVVLRAAYAAAQAGGAITMERLENAARTEYRELGKLVSSRAWE